MVIFLCATAVLASIKSCCGSSSEKKSSEYAFRSNRTCIWGHCDPINIGSDEYWLCIRWTSLASILPRCCPDLIASKMSSPCKPYCVFALVVVCEQLHPTSKQQRHTQTQTHTLFLINGWIAVFVLYETRITDVDRHCFCFQNEITYVLYTLIVKMVS